MTEHERLELINFARALGEAWADFAAALTDPVDVDAARRALYWVNRLHMEAGDTSTRELGRFLAMGPA